MSESLVLYGNRPLTSPYVFSAFVALEEKKLPFTFTLLDLAAGEQNSPAFVARSLTNRVPTLQHGDFWLAESSAITEYLDEVFPPPQYAGLYPRDPQGRARVRLVQALIRSDFQALREDRPTSTIFGQPSTRPLSAAGASSAERLIRIATSLLQPHKTTITGSFTIGDADLALVLQRLVVNGDPLPTPLRDYAHSIWQRPSVKAWLTHATPPSKP
jgi:glutathione S-transferase